MRYNKFDPDDFKKKQTKISRKTLNLILNGTCVFLIFVFIFLVTVWIRSIKTTKYETIEPEKDLFIYEDNEEYLGSCIDLFKRIRDNPNVHIPPLRTPPREMKYLFEKGGQMPITSLEYIDETYKDSKGQASEKIHLITNEELSLVNDYVEDHENSGHGPKVIKQQMLLYNDSLVNSHVLVLGSEQPWVEMIAFNLKASKIYTIDYTRKKYENPLFEWHHILDYMDYSIQNNNINHVDFAITYSTIQHAGLGRYGDALSPDGDLEMLQMMHCMLKRGGILVVGLPVAVDRMGYISFNKGRVYGNSRLKTLLNGWQIMGGKRSDDDFHTVYILKKK